MKRILIISLLVFLVSCQTVPITGRTQLSIIPSNQILSMSFSNYNEFLSKHEVITGTKDAEMVKRVGLKIEKGVARYFMQKGMSNKLEGYKWEFNLVKDKEVNAWCMPGGKVVVYTGLLPVARDEAGLAVVMGHEIAHAIAGHGNERMSQGLIVQLGGMALSVALSQKPEQTRQLFMTAFGIGAQVGILLPYSRLHESESDHLGLIFMSMAGYNPSTAVNFWQRMAALSSKGGKPPELLSTHPSDLTRIQRIEELIPEAMQYYNP